MKRATEISLSLQQRCNVLFCVKLGWTVHATKDAITSVYSRESLSESRIAYWYHAFKKGRTCIVDMPRRFKERTGRSAENIQVISDLLQQDKRSTIARLSDGSGLPPATVHRILTKDLELRKKTAKYVPHLLTEGNCARRRNTCEFFLRLIRQFPKVLSCVVTIDESWMYLYDPERKSQSKQWLRKDEDRPVKAAHPRSVKKVMIVTFFDCQGLVYHEYVQGTMKTKDFIALCTRFLAAHRLRRPRGTVGGQTFLHMDNASCHTSYDSLQFLRDQHVQVVPHPPYSPDLAPNDFWFYGRLKRDIRGVRFPNVDALKAAVMEQLSAIASHEYKDCVMRAWPRRLIRCLEMGGNYFEGIH